VHVELPDDVNAPPVTLPGAQTPHEDDPALAKKPGKQAAHAIVDEEE
jgi:hypothetical protein